MCRFLMQYRTELAVQMRSQAVRRALCGVALSIIMPEDKAEIRRNAVAFQGFSTQSSAKFAEKMCMNPYVDRFWVIGAFRCLSSSLSTTAKSNVQKMHYVLLYYLQQLNNEPLQKTQQFLLKRVVVYFAITESSSRPDTGRSCFLLKNATGYGIIDNKNIEQRWPLCQTHGKK